MLLLVVITMSLVATIAISSADNTGTMIRQASAERDMLRSRLAADSAISYVYRQLQLDKDWAPGKESVLLEDSSFRVERDFGQPEGQAVFYVYGSSGFADVELRAEYTIVEVDNPVIDHAVAFLGGDVDFNNVEIHGDLMVVDTEGGVMDYDSFSGEWEARDSGGDPTIESNGITVHGDVATSSGAELSGVSADGESASSGPIANPTWDLDRYLIPDPDTIILTDVTQVKNLTTSKTVVVVNKPGTSVEFKKCEIGGGVVMWAPSDWPQRGPARNEITWTQSKFGTADGGTGVQKHIGVIAPASRLDKANAANPGHGLFYFHEMGHMNNAEIHGALWVVNDAAQWNNVDVHFNADILEQQFQGMEAVISYVELTAVTESHDVPQPDRGLPDLF